jgi:hypothetical protein
MAHDEVLAYGGSAWSDGPHAFVFWYPNTSAEDDECKNEMTDALEEALSDLLSYGAIDYWEIGINYDHPNLADDSLSEFRNSGDDGESFKGWLKGQGYWDYSGVHVGVSENFDHAGGDSGGDTQCGTAFSTARAGYVGTEGLQGRYTNFAVQEPVHQFINYSQIEGTYLADSGNNQHEHDLGEITSNYYLTPMATLYWDTHAQHGYCAEQDSWWGDYTNTITRCTKEAVDRTASDEESNC